METGLKTTVTAAIALLLSACGTQRDVAPVENDEAVGAPADELRSATLGPLTYRYDDTHLIPADVEISIPPGYDDVELATKLIPASRADDLGDMSCTYGQSGLQSECNAEQETGITLALLPRPIDEYRAPFDGTMELEDDGIVGLDGFSFTAEAEGEGVEYHFLELGDRTILLAFRFDGTMDVQSREAIDDLVDTLSQSAVEQQQEEVV